MTASPERIAPELTVRAPLDTLTYLRGNPRKGDHERIRGILTTLGQAENLVINIGTHTGVPNEIVGGNNRVQVMRELGWSEAAVSYVDLADDVTLRKLATALNRASDGATYDERLLADMLASIAAESDLAGTGYDDEAYAELMRATDVYGDAATNFLGDLMDPPDLGDPEPRRQGKSEKPEDEDLGVGGKGPAAGYVSVSWTLLPEDREVIRKAVQHAQSRWQTGTSAAALVMLCDEYLRETK